jgi:hypothetical protein
MCASEIDSTRHFRPRYAVHEMTEARIVTFSFG